MEHETLAAKRKLLVCHRCGGSASERVRVGGLGGHCQGTGAKGLTAARHRLKRGFMPSNADQIGISEPTPPSLATRRAWADRVHDPGFDDHSLKHLALSWAGGAGKERLLGAYGIPLADADAWAAWGNSTMAERTLDGEADAEGEEAAEPTKPRRRAARKKGPPAWAAPRWPLPQRERRKEGRPAVDLSGGRLVGSLRLTMEVVTDDSETSEAEVV